MDNLIEMTASFEAQTDCLKSQINDLVIENESLKKQIKEKQDLINLACDVIEGCVEKFDNIYSRIPVVMMLKRLKNS